MTEILARETANGRAAVLNQILANRSHSNNVERVDAWIASAYGDEELIALIGADSILFPSTLASIVRGEESREQLLATLEESAVPRSRALVARLRFERTPQAALIAQIELGGGGELKEALRFLTADVTTGKHYDPELRRAILNLAQHHQDPNIRFSAAYSYFFMASNLEKRKCLQSFYRQSAEVQELLLSNADPSWLSEDEFVGLNIESFVTRERVVHAYLSMCVNYGTERVVKRLERLMRVGSESIVHDVCMALIQRPTRSAASWLREREQLWGLVANPPRSYHYEEGSVPLGRDIRQAIQMCSTAAPSMG